MRAITPVAPMRHQVSRPRLSKAHFRWQRDWSARVQRFIQVYLPLIGFALVGWYIFGDSRIRNAIEFEVGKIFRQIMVDADLAVRSVEITGADADLKAMLAGRTDPMIGKSSIELGLKDLRQSIEYLDEVRTARVTLTPNGVLNIAVERRHPVALFRNDDGSLGVIDHEGVAIRQIRERRLEPDLILLLGDGAVDHVNQALAVMSSAQDLRDRLRAFVRVGERRWNVILDREMRILLPEEKPEVAMARVMELHREDSGLLDRDLTVVDMRIPGRPTLRMSPRATETRRRENSLKSIEGEDT